MKKATKEETIVLAAENWVAIKQEIDQLTKKAEAIQEELREWVAETGAKEVGPLMAYTKKTPPILVPTIEGADKPLLTAALLARLQNTNYIKESLDVSAIMANQQRDKRLGVALRSVGLSVQSEERIYFKTRP